MNIFKSNIINAIYDYGIMAPETKWIFSVFFGFLLAGVILRGFLIYINIQMTQKNFSQTAFAKKYMSLPLSIRKVIEYFILFLGWILFSCLVHHFFSYIF